MQHEITAHDLTFVPFIDKEKIAARVAELGKQITKDYQGERPLIIGVLNGAFVFVSDLVRACEVECEVEFVRLKSYSGTSSTGEIRTIFGMNVPVEGRHVIVVEDIVDSGRTLDYFLKDVQAKNPASVRLASMLLKPEALKFPIKVDYLGFEVPNKFVVGYGLDYDGLCRNLPAIYQLKKE